MSPRLALLRAADLATALLGCWAIYAWVCVYIGLSFTGLRLGLLLPVIGAGALLWWARHDAPPSEPLPAEPPSPVPAWVPPLGFALAVGAWFGWWAGQLDVVIPGLLSAAHLATLLPASTRALGRLEAGPADLIGIALAAGIAVGATLVLNRSDIDDAYYFNAIWTHLAHPELAVLSFDGMHGDFAAPIQQLIHRPQTFELLAAVLASVPGLSAATAYYVVLPAFFAALSALGAWLLLARLSPRSAAVGVVLGMLLLLAWGDGHRTWGNYAFVRMYQGKAVFICALAPLVAHQSFRYIREGSAARLALLGAAVSAAASVTSSALVLAPIVAGLALLGATTPSVAGIRRAFIGLFATLPALGVLIRVKLELSQAAPLVTEGDVLDLSALTGEGVRGPLVLSLALALPMLLHGARSRAAGFGTRWVFLCFFLVLNGLSAPLLGDAVAALLSWRLYWVVPLPWFAAASVGLGLVLGFDKLRGRTVGWPALGLGLLCVAAAVGFGAAGRWTSDRANRVSYAFAVPKRPRAEWRLAAEVVRRAPEGSEVLAPTRVSCWLTGFEEVPELVAVRSFYTHNLARYWGEEESAQRALLQRMVEGKTNPSRTRAALRALDERCIGLVITSAAARRKSPVREGLVQRGFLKQKRGAYDLWIRDSPECAGR